MYTWLHIQCAVRAGCTYSVQPARTHTICSQHVWPAHTMCSQLICIFFSSAKLFMSQNSHFFALNLLYVTSASEVKLLRNFAFSINVTII